MAKRNRKAERELGLAPEPPLPRRNDSKSDKPPFTPQGIVARVAAAITLVCMFLPWFGIPAMNTLRNYSWMFDMMVPPGDYVFPMFSTGDAASVLDALNESNIYSSVWAVFFILWMAGVGVLFVRLIQSMLGYRETKLLFLGSVIAAATALGWIIAVGILNQIYSSEFATMTGIQVTFFEVHLGVFLVLIFGALSAFLSRKYP